MTGISNDIQSIRLEEYFNVENLSGGDILKVFGFGSTSDEMAKNSSAAGVAENYLTMGMHYLADHLGEPILRISRHSHHEVMKVDTTLSNGFAVKAGTVGIVSYEWIGYTEHDRPMFQIRVFWYLNQFSSSGRGQRRRLLGHRGRGCSFIPAGARDQGIDRAGSRHSEPESRACSLYGDDHPRIQAIPLVVTAPPGVLVSAMPEVHWKKDLRL